MKILKFAVVIWFVAIFINVNCDFFSKILGLK